jgi:transcriptional antiterminator RfaH
MHDKNWFLVQFKHKCHFIAERNLKAQGYHTFLPIEEKIVYRYGKNIATKTPLFPGYLFIEFSLALGNWSGIRSTFGVSKLISQNNKPQIIPKIIMNELINRCDENGMLLPPKSIKKGDTIVVRNSAFSKFISTIDQIDSKNRIWVLMNILGRQSRVEVKSEQIQIC